MFFQTCVRILSRYFFFRPPMPQNVKGVEEIKLHFESTEQTSCKLMLLICSSSRSCRVVFFAPSESNLREILFWLTDISPQKFGLQLSQTEQKVCVSFPPKGFIHSFFFGTIPPSGMTFLDHHPLPWVTPLKPTLAVPRTAEVEDAIKSSWPQIVENQWRLMCPKNIYLDKLVMYIYLYI